VAQGPRGELKHKIASRAPSLAGRRYSGEIAAMGRRGVLLAGLLLLAACGARDDGAPFVDSRPPPSLSLADWPPIGWAWGVIQTSDKAPAQRYGVAAAATMPRAQVLVLPGYGDFAETHFRQIRAFIGQFYVSWALDGAGQGGSGRRVSPRDLGHIDSFDPDVLAVQGLVQRTIRPTPGAPLVLIAEGAAAPVALRALQRDPSGISGLVLVRPVFRSPGGVDPNLSSWAGRLHLGFIRAPGGSGWSHDAKSPDTSTDLGRRQAWQAANPDLRMGDPSLGWYGAFADLVSQEKAAGWGRVATPVLILNDHGAADADAAVICRALPHCVLEQAGKDPTAREIAFVEGFVAKGAPIPHPLTTLSNDDPQR
jgi:lysophospholipase